MFGHKIATTSTTNGGLWTWGLGASGQLGDNQILTRSSPVQVALARRWSTMSFGASHMVAITRGQLWAWGLGTSGQIGDGTAINKVVPVQLAADKTWASVASGYLHNVAVTTAGALWGWGAGTSGALAQITAVTSHSSPVQISSDKTWASVAGGSTHTAAITTAGALWTWGLGTSGQLGLITTATNRSSPVQVASDKTWASVAAGYTHTVAITTAGALWAWGGNASGQLGQITTVANRSSPVQVASDKTWASVASNGAHTVAITTTGQLWAWGANAVGQLGQVTNVTLTSSPVQVASDKTWSMVAAGGTHTAAITTAGTLWSWGADVSGQLGRNTSNINASSPVQVGFFSNWSKVSAGRASGAAIPG